MFLSPFVQQCNNTFSVSRQQGSDFAKQLAGDFNPLHDDDAKRFVVPGDLLFCFVVEKHGISEYMHFEFSSMVSADTPFTIEENQQGNLLIESSGKTCCTIKRNGSTLKNEKNIESIAKQYVKFSGETFPDILVPLMQQKQLMINPARPMVMYQSMTIHLDDLTFNEPSLKMASQHIDIDGKRGSVCIHFNLLANEKIVGRGEKQFLLSGLRAYEPEAMDKLVTDYQEKKAHFLPK